MKRPTDLFIAGFAIALGVLGWWAGARFAELGLFDHQHNQFFDADPNRVIYNSTSFDGPYQRSRTHPLHVLLVAPVGHALARSLGSPAHAVLVLTGLFSAGVLWNVNDVLRRQLGLGAWDRLLLVGLLAASASQVTFAMVPDTHVLSAFGLSGLARSVGTVRGPDHLRSSSVLEWLRSGGAKVLVWGAFATGMLVTNVILVAWLCYLLSSAHGSGVRRFWFSGVGAAAVVGLVAGLHLAQLGLWPSARSEAEVARDDDALRALATEQATRSRDLHQLQYLPIARQLGQSPVQEPSSPGDAEAIQPVRFVGLSGIVEQTRERIRYNTTYVTPLQKLPSRAVQVVATVLVNAFYAPAFRVTHRWYPPVTVATCATFEPWSWDHRLWGGLGAGLWISWFAWVTYRASRRRASDAVGNSEATGDSHTVLMRFNLMVVGAYAGIVWVYGDELFLYSPNWTFAVVLVVGGFYARALRYEGRTTRWVQRGALGVALICLVANTAGHVRDLFALFL